MDDVSKRVKRVRVLVPFFRLGDLFLCFYFQKKMVEIDYRNEWHVFIFNRLKKTIIYDKIMT